MTTNPRDMRFKLVAMNSTVTHGRTATDALVEQRARECMEHGPDMTHIGQPCGVNRVIASDGYPRRVKRNTGLKRTLKLVQ